MNNKPKYTSAKRKIAHSYSDSEDYEQGNVEAKQEEIAVLQRPRRQTRKYPKVDLSKINVLTQQEEYEVIKTFVQQVRQRYLEQDNEEDLEDDLDE